MGKKNSNLKKPNPNKTTPQKLPSRPQQYSCHLASISFVALTGVILKLHCSSVIKPRNTKRQKGSGM